MRILVMFDLPMETNEDKRAYRHFRNHLIKSGFFMFQESIYNKVVLNQQSADAVVDNLEKVKPLGGFVVVLKITEKQFAKMKCLVGETKTNVIHTDERLVFL
jgi:CRISPR-associated protein Cas2